MRSHIRNDRRARRGAAFAVVGLVATLLTGSGAVLARHDSVARATTSQGQAILDAAMGYAVSPGQTPTTPYCYGGGDQNGPNKKGTLQTYSGPTGQSGCTPGVSVAFDCSGLTQYAVYQGTGILLPRTSEDQVSASGGTVIASTASAQKGDLIFFEKNGTTDWGHVGVYDGNNGIVNAYDFKNNGSNGTNNQYWGTMDMPLSWWSSNYTMKIVRFGSGDVGSVLFAGWQTAFRAGSGTLWVAGADTKNLSLGTAPGTSPSITALSDGTTASWEAAFQAPSHELWVVGKDSRNLAYGVAPGTSPSITGLQGGGWEAAFQSPSHELWVVGADTRNLGYGVAPGTSPSITALAGGGWEVAWQAPSGTLWVAGADSRDLGYGMAAGTSPTITGLTGGGWQAAFQASSGHLWIAGADTRDLGYAVATGTSPAITALAGDHWVAAFQSPSHELWVVGADNRDLGYGVAVGTSPSIAGLAGGGWEAAFQSPSHVLWVAGADTRNVGYGMATDGSPCITGAYGGGCAPSGSASSPTPTPTPTPSVTPTHSTSPSPSPSHSSSPSPSPTVTGTPTSPTVSESPSPSASPTDSGSPSPSDSPTDSPHPTPTTGRVVATVSHNGSPVNHGWVCLAAHKSSAITRHRSSVGNCVRADGGQVVLKGQRAGSWHVLWLHSGHRALSTKTVHVTAGGTAYFTRSV